MLHVNLSELSVRKQCELLCINRSSLYYTTQSRPIDEVMLMNLLRDAWLKRPFYGYRRITVTLQRQGVKVNRKRVQRLMQVMGIQALSQGVKTSKGNKKHKKHPYLLSNLQIKGCNHAWMVDITYLRLGKGFMYLTALIDVHSRYVVGWSLGNTLDTEVCLVALNHALKISPTLPEIINSDQGAQFTSEFWIKALLDKGIKVSMTGKGRCLDNIYIERFWKSLKYEEIYLNDYDTVTELEVAVKKYIEFYNDERPHQSLDYRIPSEVYFKKEELECNNNFILMTGVGENLVCAETTDLPMQILH